MTGCSIWLDGIRRLPFCENSSMLSSQKWKMDSGTPLTMVPACPCQKSCKPAMDLLACVTSPIRRRTSGSLRAWRCLGRESRVLLGSIEKSLSYIICHNLRVQLIYHGLSHYWSTNQWKKRTSIWETYRGRVVTVTITGWFQPFFKTMSVGDYHPQLMNH